jgi:hypothetical protein
MYCRPQVQSALVPEAPAATGALTTSQLRSLYDAFHALTDPRNRHGWRYDPPFLLACLVAVGRCVTLLYEDAGQRQSAPVG